MKTTPDLERVFPLSGGSELRPSLRPPRLTALVKTAPGVVMFNRVFNRTWTGRRAGAATLLTRAV